MNHAEKRLFLIRELLREREDGRSVDVPADAQEQKMLLRGLMNVRPAAPVSADFAAAQDEYLQEAIREKGITELDDLAPAEEGIYLWQGDITTLRCDAIVNAANSGMTGCYRPCHNCIDNCIHTYAGVQLREACAEIMARQGHAEPTGQAKLTPAYNLPARYVIHTVGPIVDGPLTAKQESQLVSCYRSCLALAEEHGVKSLAFCCISTGVFGFPPKRAAELAVQTVRAYRENGGSIEVIFNVFQESDERLYRSLLG